MGRSRYQPEAIFQRAVRRAVRDYVRDTGQVPSLMAAVSEGASPRTLHLSMRLDLLEDRLAVQAHVQGMVREHGSCFAAVGGLTRERTRLAVTVVSADRADMWSAAVDELDGIAGWHRGGAELLEGAEWMQRAIRQAKEET